MEKLKLLNAQWVLHALNGKHLIYILATNSYENCNVLPDVMLTSVMGEGKRSFLRAAEEESAVQEYEMTGDPFTTILTDAARAGVNAALVVWPAPAEADGEEEGGAGQDVLSLMCKTHVMIIWERTRRLPCSDDGGEMSVDDEEGGSGEERRREREERRKEDVGTIMGDFEKYCRCPLILLLPILWDQMISKWTDMGYEDWANTFNKAWKGKYIQQGQSPCPNTRTPALTPTHTGTTEPLEVRPRQVHRQAGGVHRAGVQARLEIRGQPKQQSAQR